MRSREREATAVLDQQLQQAMAASLQQQAAPEIEFAAFKPVAQQGNARMSMDEPQFNAYVFAVPSPRTSVGDPPFPSSSLPVRAPPAEAAAVDIDVGDIELVEDSPGAGGGRLMVALEQGQQRGGIESPARAARYQQRMDQGQWNGGSNAPRSPSSAQVLNQSVSPLRPSRAQRSLLPNPASAPADPPHSLSPLALARRKAAERQQWHSLALKLGLPTAAEAQAFAEEQNYSQETINELLLAEQ
jgi:hypothetical protein